tara:strand:- start:773 stop:1243 length:471 start_codon:yes stop_codon:yes gene_type:complete
MSWENILRKGDAWEMEQTYGMSGDELVEYLTEDGEEINPYHTLDFHADSEDGLGTDEILNRALGSNKSIKDLPELRDKEPEMRKKLAAYLKKHYPDFAGSEDYWMDYFFGNSSFDGPFWPEERNGKLWDGYDEFEDWDDWRRNTEANNPYFYWWKQ